MNNLPRLLFIVGVVCLTLAMLVRSTNTGVILPSRLMPLNWLKLADTFTLFSIAISLMRLTKVK